MKIKKLMAILLSATMAVPFALAACSDGGNDDVKDDTQTVKPGDDEITVGKPVVTLTGETLSWQSVENAEKYNVYCNGTLVSEKQTGTTYTINQTEEGEYSYTVEAVNETKNKVGEKSDAVTYVYSLTDTSEKLQGKIYVVGDSTVCDFSDGYYLPRKGYGTQLYNYINCEPNQIVNLAISGRSSKSFLTESNYATLQSHITAGDYLIIGFGHNDEKSDDPARFTDPKGDKATAGSFQNVLYENYVKLAKDKGATPILCTPIVRYDSSNAYTGSVAHVTSDGDYPAAIRTLGAETETTVIDLTKITADIYKADNDAAQYFHAHTTYKSETDKTPAGRDSTHLNLYGAKVVAYNLASALRSSDCALKNNVITNSKSPKYDVDFSAAINESYVKPDYKPFDESQNESRKLASLTTNQTNSNWYKTVFGNVGGASKLGDFTTSYAGDKFTVGTTNNYGKFEEKADGTGVDGFAAVFTKVSASKNFTVSAHVKLTQIGTTSGQTGFGLMLRDDIYLDDYNTTTVSNFVAAGILGNAKAIFNREKTEDGTHLYNYNDLPSASVVGSEYDLTITRVGQSVDVTVQVVGGATYTKNFTDYDFLAIDNENMYICLFSTRGDVVEFTNVSFEITGDSQGA